MGIRLAYIERAGVSAILIQNQTNFMCPSMGSGTIVVMGLDGKDN